MDNSEKERLKEFWNKKARSFPRFEKGENNYEAGVLRSIREAGIKFHGKNILDVGAGSGMYTIRLAQMAQSVLAIDISSEMLEILKKDAQAQGLNNLEYVCADWLDFASEKKFDLIFASMTPALKDDEGRERLLNFSAKDFVFIGYRRNYASNILKGLLAHYKVSNKILNSTADMKEWLDQKDVYYQTIPVVGQWEVPWREEDLLKSCLTTLSGHEVEAEADYVLRHIKRFADEKGRYLELTPYEIEIIIWQAEK